MFLRSNTLEQFKLEKNWDSETFRKSKKEGYYLYNKPGHGCSEVEELFITVASSEDPVSLAKD